MRVPTRTCNFGRIISAPTILMEGLMNMKLLQCYVDNIITTALMEDINYMDAAADNLIPADHRSSAGCTGSSGIECQYFTAGSGRKEQQECPQGGDAQSFAGVSGRRKFRRPGRCPTCGREYVRPAGFGPGL